MATATQAKTKETPKAKPTTGSSASSKAAERRRAGRQQIERGVETTDQILEQLKSGSQSVIGAVRKFVDQVDDALPGSSDGPTRGRDIIDSALEMSDRVVEGGADAIRGVVKSAGGSISKAVE